MTTYIAFLRGINVGAHNRMSMEDLRAVFEELGYQSVQTYIQSGNVVFDTTETDESTIRSAIAAGIDEEFGYNISVMLRTKSELDGVVEGQPFAESADEPRKRYVTFLHEPPTDDQRAALLDAQSAAENFEVRGREVYSELDKETLGDGRFTDVGAILDMDGTRRTWAVVTAVAALGG